MRHSSLKDKHNTRYKIQGKAVNGKLTLGVTLPTPQTNARTCTLCCASTAKPHTQILNPAPQTNRQKMRIKNKNKKVKTKKSQNLKKNQG